VWNIYLNFVLLFNFKKNNIISYKNNKDLRYLFLLFSNFVIIFLRLQNQMIMIQLKNIKKVIYLI